MKKLVKKILTGLSKKPKINTEKQNRILLETKVDEGTKKAVKEYGEVFRRLAEFDRV